MIYNLVFSILPKNFLSRMFGFFSQIKYPRWLSYTSIKVFAYLYKINLEEAEKTSLSDYDCLGNFFIRTLKEEARPVDKSEKSVISPVDGLISHFGKINQNSIIQAKGINYNVLEFLNYSKNATNFLDGDFITLYLAPNDYHRIHTPIDGEITSYSYEPGELYPVNSTAISYIPKLFCKNERLISFLQTPKGNVAIVKVGAYNVGKIKVTYDEKIQTNVFLQGRKEHFYLEPISMKKGQELGRFEMGSTVVMIFEHNMVEFLSITAGQKVLFGQPIANLI